MNALKITRAISILWNASAPLTGVGLAMLVVFATTLAGLALDPRTVGGVAVWLKPAKFAISTAIYGLTFAWLFTYLDGWPRLKRIVGHSTAAVLVIEVGLISLQAARGVQSHFNVGSAVDGAIFAVMGLSILVAWGMSIVLAIALFRQAFADRALGWAIRLGLVITILGSGAGGFMTSPTPEQLAGARETGRLPVAGQHTVGGPDGGPGVPGTGWSTEHGDLRVAHFAGLHGVQILPLAALVLRGALSDRRRRRLVLVGSVSYGALFLILLLQALGGQSVTSPGGTFGTALLAWAVGTAGLTAIALAGRPGVTIAAPKAVVS